jgi:Glycosyltransferase family 87
MKFARPSLQFLVLGVAAVVFLVAGGRRAFHISYDFVPVYTGAGCLLHGCNPYNTSQLEQQFFRAGGRADELNSWDIDVPVYPPSTFLALAPLALLSYPAARLLWFVVNGSLFVTSAVLVLSLCPRTHRWLATILSSLILATSGILLVLGQPAVFAISLVIIGSYLFLRGRWLPLATVLCMLSLAVKPQIGGLIMLYFLSQRIHWRYVVAALAGALILLLSGSLLLSLHPGSSAWPATLRANLSATLSPGGSADPRPANQEAIGDANLQPLTSIVFSDAGRFNLAAYAIFLGLLAVWVMAVPWTKVAPAMHFLALSGLSVLSLLPVYHRFYDTRLLLLSVPAVMILFEKRRFLGGAIAIVTALAVISVQYRVQVFLVGRAEWQNILQNKLLFILLLRQQNLELLLLFCLYLAGILQLKTVMHDQAYSERTIADELRK